MLQIIVKTVLCRHQDEDNNISKPQRDSCFVKNAIYFLEKNSTMRLNVLSWSLDTVTVL